MSQWLFPMWQHLVSGSWRVTNCTSSNCPPANTMEWVPQRPILKVCSMKKVLRGFLHFDMHLPDDQVTNSLLNHLTSGWTFFAFTFFTFSLHPVPHTFHVRQFHDIIIDWCSSYYRSRPFCIQSNSVSTDQFRNKKQLQQKQQQQQQQQLHATETKRIGLKALF